MSGYRMLIGGELVAGGASLDVINPATGAAFARVPHATKADADAAIAAAKAAVPGWSAVTFAERQAKLVALADAVAAHGEELARLITQEQGKPLPEAMGEVAWTEGYLRHYATLELPDRVIQDDESGYIAVQHRPLGVIVGIIAWNFPLLVACSKIGPAVLAGNAIVLKPAPTTPVTALRLGELCREIFPAGVVNIITGEDDLGPMITQHPDIDKITFTGSTATGKKIMEGASADLKRITLELGGNDASIVLPDADPKKVAEQLFWSSFMNAGQICVAAKRVYIHEDIYDELSAAIVEYAKTVKVGDGSEQPSPCQGEAAFDEPVSRDAAWERAFANIRDETKRLGLVGHPLHGRWNITDSRLLVAGLVGNGSAKAAPSLSNRSGAVAPPLLLTNFLNGSQV